MQHDVTAGIATVRSASLTPSPRAAIRCLVVMGALCASAAAVLSVGASRAEAHPTGARDAALIGAPVELAALAAACDTGDAVACNDLGVSYEHGYSVESDSRIAATLFERACSGGVADGCNNLGALHERGDGTESCLDAAFDLYERACEQKSALGCSNLGALYARGAGRAVDRDEAERLFSLACTGGSATGCQNLETLVSR